MEKRRILIVSGAFLPDISPRSYRTTELAKELARQGHDVTVIIPLNGHNYHSFEKEHELKIKSIGTLKWKDIKLKGGKIELLFRRVLKRVLKMVFEWPDIELAFKVHEALKTESNYDILISVAVPYPIHWGVASIVGNNREITRCWIADCGDPYMGDTTDSFRKLFYFKYVEKWFCRRADYITVPFKGAVNAYYPEFHNKIRIIPQGFSLDNLSLSDTPKVNDYPIFAYAGGFIPGKRDPGQMLKFLEGWKEDFRFIVFTSQDGLLADARDKLGCKLEIRPFIPRAELLVILSEMDFLVNFDNNVTTQLPSKLIDYAITGRPVLNITKDDDFIGLAQFLEGDYSKRMILEKPENYDIRHIARQFVNLQTE